MIKGNFGTFVDLFSPLVEQYGDFNVYVSVFDSAKSFEASPIKTMLPLYKIETSTIDQKEVCLLVKGLGEVEENEEQSPLTVSQLYEHFFAIREMCKDHIIVLGQKDIDMNESDEDGEKGDYIIIHLPAAEIKTSSDDSKNIFYFMILPFNKEYEHVHYGNIYNPDSKGIVYRNEQLDT